ncbi:MAG TPA: nuclear transport factor 2 family protein [Ktedonobacteraceae bacterium]|jgi:predicted ester cyclase|nr:nuclear transport factor 2 family protein [Ktedonobacteraceae bacterium]
MSKTQTVEAFSEAMEARDWDKVATYLSDDFTLSGPTPQPVGKNEFIAIQSAFMNAFPDWSFNLGSLEEQGDKVLATVHITGTHTRDLLVPGLPPVPATNKRVSLPEEHLEFTFHGDKIASLSSDNVPGGGVPGVLQQIGVPLPSQA